MHKNYFHNALYLKALSKVLPYIFIGSFSHIQLVSFLTWCTKLNLKRNFFL